MSKAAAGSGRPRRISSADVAAAAGVSRTTVSYVFTDAPGTRIPDETRQRVLEAAAELGYTPSAAARGLRSGRSRLMLLLLPHWMQSPSALAFAGELTAQLAHRDLSLIVHVVGPGSEDHQRLWREVTPSVVLSFVPLEEEVLRSMRGAGIEVAIALFDRPAGAEGEHAAPDGQLGRAQVDHLAGRGHTRLAFTWPTDPMLAPFATGRLAGVRAGCREHGLPEPVVAEIAEPADLRAGLEAWLADGVTAVCAYNDDVAIAVLAAARALGVEVPGRLAVVGVDNTAAGALMDPPLTTVDYNVAALATYAAETAHARLNGLAEPAVPSGDQAVTLTVRGTS